MDSKKLFKLSKSKQVWVIEDAAHSFGAKYEDGSMVGSCKYSDMTVFSSHPSNYYYRGRGVITTIQKNLRQSIKLRSHGIEKNFKLWKNKKLGFSKK